MVVAYKNLNSILQEPPDYGFKRIIYIRGTKEGYQNIKPLADSYFSSSRNRNKSLEAARAMKKRYVGLKNQGYDGKLALTEQDVIRMQDEFVEALGEGLSNAKIGEKVGSVLQSTQKMIWSMQKNSAKEMADEIYKIIEDLEEYFNTLNLKKQADLLGLMQPELVEGSIINIENGQIIFSRIRKTLDRLSQLTGSHPYTFMVNMNRELGAIAETGEVWATNLAMSTIENSLLGKKYPGGHFIDTGAQKAITESGTLGTAKSDAMFTYQGTYNGEKFDLQLGVSFKATGSVVDSKTGKWSVKKNFPKIQIASISEQSAVWNFLARIYGSSVFAQNSLLNTLVWASPNSKSMQLIRKDLTSYYFDKFISGSGGKLSGGTGFDQADCLVVNSTPIPIMSIIGEVISDLEQNKNSQFVFMNLSVKNPWKGTDEKDLTLAVQRSKEVREAVMKDMILKVSLNGNILYNLAKTYKI